jgi:hypothetical protein
MERRKSVKLVTTGGEEDGDLKRRGRWQPQDGTNSDYAGEEYDGD